MSTLLNNFREKTQRAGVVRAPCDPSLLSFSVSSSLLPPFCPFRCAQRARVPSDSARNLSCVQRAMMMRRWAVRRCCAALSR